MSYSGTTALSTVSNPPRLVVGRLAGIPGTTALSTTDIKQASQGGNLWFYSSTNLTTDITASNFFSDGWYIGMRAGDCVYGVQFSSAASTVTTFVGAVVSASTAGVSLSTGSLITSTFN
jgi:hypothetical protein